jgi:hypothetical protein
MSDASDDDSMPKPHQVSYNGETIEVWREPITGQWQCMIVARRQGADIGPDADFDSPEAAIDAAMKMIDDGDEEF